MNFLQKRKIERRAREALRQSRHLRNMREDLMSDAELRKLGNAETRLKETIRAGDWDRAASRGDDLVSCISGLVPGRRFSGFRENFEILAVAVAVAMGFRTYFLQPFKIPTGSMQPTLYGIHSRVQPQPTFFDQMPLKLLKWLLLGEWYVEVRAQNSGSISYGDGSSPGQLDRVNGYVYVDTRPHAIPRDVTLSIPPGTRVEKGTLLWSGIRIAGDHVFVDKIRWNFSRPKRGQIVVFNTDNIPIVPAVPRGTHYIKRLVGLPTDDLGIRYNSITLHNDPIPDPRSAAIQANRAAQYPPYHPAGMGDHRAYTSRRPLIRDGDTISLGPKEYLAFGDNTLSSLDGRYWGPVPERNLVGPAVIVYWPFSSRWGIAR